jgi:hypothetical protein
MGKKVRRETGWLRDSGARVDLENRQSMMSCPIDVQSRSAIYHTSYSSTMRPRSVQHTYFESVKYDIKFYGVLESNCVIYFARIRQWSKNGE